MEVMKQVFLALMVVEACVMAVSALAYLIHLLDKVGIYRYHVYSIFLVVPSGLLRALASKQVTIEGEGDDDDDDGEPAAQSQPSAAAPNVSQMKAGSSSSRWTKAVGVAKVGCKQLCANNGRVVHHNPCG